jgi:hypothetical protein
VNVLGTLIHEAVNGALPVCLTSAPFRAVVAGLWVVHHVGAFQIETQAPAAVQVADPQTRRLGVSPGRRVRTAGYSVPAHCPDRRASRHAKATSQYVWPRSVRRGARATLEIAIETVTRDRDAGTSPAVAELRQRLTQQLPKMWLDADWSRSAVARLNAAGFNLETDPNIPAGKALVQQLLGEELHRDRVRQVLGDAGVVSLRVPAAAPLEVRDRRKACSRSGRRATAAHRSRSSNAAPKHCSRRAAKTSTSSSASQPSHRPRREQQLIPLAELGERRELGGHVLEQLVLDRHDGGQGGPLRGHHSCHAAIAARLGDRSHRAAVLQESAGRPGITTAWRANRSTTYAVFAALGNQVRCRGRDPGEIAITAMGSADGGRGPGSGGWSRGIFAWKPLRRERLR